MTNRNARRVGIWSRVGAVTAASAFAGCATTSDPGFRAGPPAAASAPAIARPVERQDAPAVRPVAYTEPRATHLRPEASPFDGRSSVTAEDVIQQVLARNPSLAQMSAAIQAAAARFPQVTSFDDPVLTAWMAPGTINDRPPDYFYSQRVEISQKVPFAGKRALRGESAKAQIVAASGDLEDTKLELVEAARLAIADYYLAERGLEVNAEGLRLLREFQQNAEARYKTGQAPQQDILQAGVELGRQEEQRLAWERARTVAVARLNTLMNRPPDGPIPPPAGPAGTAAMPADAKALRDLALSRRPDLQALAARIAADRAALGLAEREYYPDVEFMAAYDSFWNMAQQQGQIGLRFNLPVQLKRRAGAVAEAEALLAQRQAQLSKQSNQVAFEVEQALARVRESERAVKLYQDRILPAARENVKSAQAAYVTGKVPFLSLIEAERSLIGLLDRYYEAVAESVRRWAALERVVGGPPAAAATPNKPLPEPRALPTTPEPADGPRQPVP